MAGTNITLHPVIATLLQYFVGTVLFNSVSDMAYGLRAEQYSIIRPTTQKSTSLVALHTNSQYALKRRNDGVMTQVRKAAVADMFYPGDRDELHRMITQMLAEADEREGTPKAIIAPHAGYIYSGPIAASAYHCLEGAQHISRVVIAGPSHRVAFDGIALSAADTFETPLGTVHVDKKTSDALAELPFVEYLDQAHEMEHALEVHLPFLQEILGEFEMVPLVVGDASPADVAKAFELAWGGSETLLLLALT